MPNFKNLYFSLQSSKHTIEVNFSRYSFDGSFAIFFLLNSLNSYTWNTFQHTCLYTKIFIDRIFNKISFKWHLFLLNELRNTLKRISSSTVTSHVWRARASGDVKEGVLWTFYCCSPSALASVVSITRPRSELVVPIWLRRTAREESIVRLWGWYGKPLGAGAVVYKCLWTPNWVDSTLSFLNQSISIAPYKWWWRTSWVSVDTVWEVKTITNVPSITISSMSVVKQRFPVTACIE